jgi:hemerythrin
MYPDSIMSRYQSPVVEIDEIPVIAHEGMHQTHLEEIVLINDLGRIVEQAIDGDIDKDVVSDKLKDWVEHTRQHFAEENRLMEEFDFPAYPMHRAEHERVFKLIESLQKIWMDSSQLDPLADFIFFEWPVWFDGHVNTMDMVTAQFLSQIMPEDDEAV